MNDRFFLDTNILVYTFDHSAPTKREIARKLVEEALVSGHGMISTQVIGEFLNVATRKFTPPLSTEDAKKYLEAVLNPLCRATPDGELFNLGLSIREMTGYSFYDSMVLAAAKRGGCNRLFTEDLQTGRTVLDVEVINPF